MPIDNIRPMDMKLISAIGHMLASRPQSISTVHSKTIPERPNIRDIYHAHKLLEAIAAQLENLYKEIIYFNSTVIVHQ